MQLSRATRNFRNRKEFGFVPIFGFIDFLFIYLIRIVEVLNW